MKWNINNYGFVKKKKKKGGSEMHLENKSVLKTSMSSFTV